MTQVHEDAEPVHLQYDLTTKVAQTIMFSIATSRVADVVVAIMAERHIDNAAMFEFLQQPDVLTDGIAVLDTA